MTNLALAHPQRAPVRQLFRAWQPVDRERVCSASDQRVDKRKPENRGRGDKKERRVKRAVCEPLTQHRHVAKTTERTMGCPDSSAACERRDVDVENIRARDDKRLESAGSVSVFFLRIMPPG